MLSLSNICLGNRLKGVSFTLDGVHACIVSDDPSAICDIISGVTLPSSGKLERSGAAPLLARGCPLPEHMTVKSYFRAVSALSGNPVPDFVYDKAKALLDKRIGSLTRLERAKVGVLSVLIPEAETVVCEHPTEGLDFGEAIELLSILLSNEHPSYAVFTADSVSDLRRAEVAIAIDRGEVIFIGTPNELISSASGASALTVRVMGDRKRLDAVFADIEVSVSDTEKKNVYAVTLPVGFSAAEVKTMLRGSGVTFLEASRENDRLKRLVSSLERKEETKKDELEAKIEKNSPKKSIDPSLFAFNRDTENEFEDDDDDEGEPSESTLFSGRREER